MVGAAVESFCGEEGEIRTVVEQSESELKKEKESEWGSNGDGIKQALFCGW